MRELDESSPVSSPEVVVKNIQTAFVPQSLSHRRLTRSARRQKPTCLVFGPLQKAIYSDYFFCHNCKMYEDAVSSGEHHRIDRESRRYRCTANHTDFCFPTNQLLIEQVNILPSTQSSCKENVVAEAACNKSVDTCSDEELADQDTWNLCSSVLTSAHDAEGSDLAEAFDTLAEAYYGLEK